MTVTREAVIEKLSTIKGPDLKGDIVSLGLVSEIFIADGKVFFSITVPAERAKELEPLREAAERAVKELPGVANAVVALTAEREGGASDVTWLAKAAQVVAEAVACRPATATLRARHLGTRHLVIGERHGADGRLGRAGLITGHRSSPRLLLYRLPRLGDTLGLVQRVVHRHETCSAFSCGGEVSARQFPEAAPERVTAERGKPPLQVRQPAGGCVDILRQPLDR